MFRTERRRKKKETCVRRGEMSVYSLPSTMSDLKKTKRTRMSGIDTTALGSSFKRVKPAAHTLSKQDKERLARVEAVLTQGSTRHAFTFMEQDSIPCDGRVLDILQHMLPHLDADSWEDRQEWGGVFVNGRPVLDCSKTTLKAPARLEYFEPALPIPQMRASFPVFDRSWIVFEDEYMIAVYKPPQLPSKPPKEQRHCALLNYLESYVGKGVKIHMPSRLDWDTQGLVLVSKAKQMNNLLQRLFSEREVKKLYAFETLAAQGESKCGVVQKEKLKKKKKTKIKFGEEEKMAEVDPHTLIRVDANITKVR